MRTWRRGEEGAKRRVCRLRCPPDVTDRAERLEPHRGADRSTRRASIRIEARSEESNRIDLRYSKNRIEVRFEESDRIDVRRIESKFDIRSFGSNVDSIRFDSIRFDSIRLFDCRFDSILRIDFFPIRFESSFDSIRASREGAPDGARALGAGAAARGDRVDEDAPERRPLPRRLVRLVLFRAAAAAAALAARRAAAAVVVERGVAALEKEKEKRGGPIASGHTARSHGAVTRRGDTAR